MDELASAAKVAQVITCVGGIVGEGQHTLYSVIVHISNTVEGIDKHRVAVRLRNVKADETKGGSNKVI
jgi:hypothetical protein